MNKEVEITISEMQLNGTTAIRIIKCLKEHEPEIWHELKETIKQKLPIPDVRKSFAVGKIVEVKDCFYGHQFNKGELLRIIRHDSSSAARWLCSNTRSEYLLSEREANVC